MILERSGSESPWRTIAMAARGPKALPNSESHLAWTPVGGET